MSEINSKKSRSEAMLSAALHELSRSAPQSAPSELGHALAAKFHRHHLRRRIVRRTAALTAALAVCAGLLWLRPGSAVGRDAKHVSTQIPDSRPQTVLMKDATATPRPRERQITPGVVPRTHRVLRAGTKANSPVNDPFVALPLFAFRAPQEELRIVRIEMPVSSLRLLGAHVNDEMITRRVTADLLVGPDGTPYAFRLVT
jgi:hypothetical protein